jgi:hypothetical protein
MAIALFDRSQDIITRSDSKRSRSTVALNFG